LFSFKLYLLLTDSSISFAALYFAVYFMFREERTLESEVAVAWLTVGVLQ